MTRTWAGALLMLLPMLSFADEGGLSKKPITTDNGPVGKLLRRWYAEGTAAGNVGDWYDNRDGEHSPLDIRAWPQLQKVSYTEADLKGRRNWALMTGTRKHVTFGNSSTSAPPEMSGSNPRSAYCTPGGLEMLHKQYSGNNLYIYPEHRDHDPGHNGVGDGYGDLYPTNSPYLIISQGSSGSDQPFLRALPVTLAAFRPDAKAKLIEAGALMPAVQMVFRASNRHLKDPKEYLTGKAHPTVFEGAWVDEARMVELAHSLTADALPPVARLSVEEEDEPRPGRDFFEPAGLTEKLADTPGCVARVWRGTARKRRLLVSAAGSVDLNKKPLTFTWVLLRGDPKRVTITPRDKAGTAAVLEVEYHDRMPVAPGSPMESNRVDIGCFAHNGHHHSAPAFVTFFSLDSEARTYDDRGRILEVGYSAGATVRTVTDFGGVLAALADGPAARLLRVTPAHREALKTAAGELAPLADEQKQAREKRQDLEKDRAAAEKAVKEAEMARQKAAPEDQKDADAALGDAKARLKKAEQARADADKRLTDLTNRIVAVLDRPRPPLDLPPRAFLDRLLAEAARNPAFWNRHLSTLAPLYADAPAPRQRAIDAARRALTGAGVVEKSDIHKLAFRPARDGEGDPAARLSRHQLALLEQFQSVALAELLFPGQLQVSWRANFVDPRLTLTKPWRDVYRYDAVGNLAGWTRYQGDGASEYTPGGFLVTKTDEKGRAVKARTVLYRPGPAFAGRFGPGPLAPVKGDEVVTIEWEGDTPTVTKREKLFLEPKP